MKKYTILISIILGIGILFIYLTCTYFDAFEAAGIKPQEPMPGDNMFWITEFGDIYWAPLDNLQNGTGITIDPGQAQGTPMCITTHFDEGRIYWAMDIDAVGCAIYKAKYCGRRCKQIYINDGGAINSIAIDHTSNMLYFNEDEIIWKIPVDGGTKSFVYDNGDGSPVSDLTLDTANNLIYYADNTDGLNIINMIPPAYPSWEPNDGYPVYQLSFDYNDNEIYWAGYNGNKIYRGQIGELINTYTVTSDCAAVYDLVSDPVNGYIYWLDEGNVDPPHAIFRMNSDGTGQKEVVVDFTGGDAVYFFTIDFQL